MSDTESICGVYRSKDPIQNFRIRVKLERLTSSALLPSLPALAVQKDLLRLLEHNEEEEEKSKKKKKRGKKTDPTDAEELVIAWQEKLFNRIEFDDYAHDPGANGDPKERRYFEQVQRMKQNGQRPGRIYTYVEGDPFDSIEIAESFLTDSPNEEPTRLAVGMTMMRRRRPMSSKNPIKERPSNDEICSNHFSVPPYQTMYIMADLSDRRDQATAHLVVLPQPIEERLLCRIRFFSNGTLLVEPDFNSNKTPYVIETGTRFKEVFQYHLEHASTPIDISDWKREQQLIREIHLQQQKHRMQLIGKQFECPKNETLKLNLFGEIVSAKNFEYDNLYVSYQLDLPPNWYADKSTVFSGYTPTGSTAKSSEYDDIVYYSSPFEFEVWYQPPLVRGQNSFPEMPKMYFQVSSNDTWERHRTEGYTYIDIPSIPGCYNEHLSCWRPEGNSIFDELRRYFIGSSVELDDLSAVAIPQMHREEKNTKPFSRFGFRTISTGEIHLRLYVVFQSENIAMAYRRQRSMAHTDRAEFDSWMSNVHSVLDEFERVKQRAREIQQSVVYEIDQESSVF